MENYKKLKDCEHKEWVYSSCGELYQYVKEDKFNHLTSGYINRGCSEETIVYPLTIHNKIIAEGINHYYKKMHDNHMISGSKLINWLDEEMHKLMTIPLDAEESEYRKVWDEIEVEYYRLLDIRKRIDELEKNFK